MTTLAETRHMTLDGAVATLEQLAHCACRLARTQALKEKALLDIESRHHEATKDDRNEAEMLTLRLKEFCRANPHHFVRPRKVKTPFGEFGLQIVTDLKIDSAEALIQVLLDRGYDDCIERVIKPKKDAIRARIEAGEAIPGATIRTDANDPVVKVSRDMLKAAIDSPQ